MADISIFNTTSYTVIFVLYINGWRPAMKKVTARKLITGEIFTAGHPGNTLLF
jgi:hypothetical protein